MYMRVKLNEDFCGAYHQIYLARGQDHANNRYADQTKTIPIGEVSGATAEGGIEFGVEEVKVGRSPPPTITSRIRPEDAQLQAT